MRPVTKVILYGSVVTPLFLSTVALFFFGAHQDSIKIQLVSIVLFLAVTLFASLSKFAKEVIKILDWKWNRQPFETYPDTEAKRNAMRYKGGSLRIIKPLASAVITKRDEHACQEIKVGISRDPDAIDRAKSEMLAHEELFRRKWDFLHHHDVLPINPRTGEPWESREAFLGTTKSQMRSQMGVAVFA